MSRMNNIASYIRLLALSVLLVTVCAAEEESSAAATAAESSSMTNMLVQAVKFIDHCGERDLTTCIKARALEYLDSASGNIQIAEGLTLEETKTDEVNEAASSPVQEEEARSMDLDDLLVNRASEFLSSHTLVFKLPKTTVAEMKRNLDADEGRKKKKKMLLPLLLLLKLKAAILLPLLLGAIALIAFKALVIGKIALVISGIIALKKLLESKHSSQTYEVVAHPHHSSSHISTGEEHHGHYKRSIADNIDHHYLPYSAYVNK